jgi:hypothetical protein
LADFVIIDVPATTCLEAMIKGLPIFLIMKHIKYLPEARMLLEKRAVCCDEPERLLQKVEDFILYGKYEADINNNEFLSLYGTDVNNFNAVEKTASEVIGAIR